MSPVNLSETLEKYPFVRSLANLIADSNPLQRKSLMSQMADQPAEHWEMAEELAKTLSTTLLKNDGERRAAAAAYNRMCKDILAEEIRFKRTGFYPCESAAAAKALVYDNPEMMKYYMMGLMLSYLFWPNHNAMFRFFRKALDCIAPVRFLEVGAGHGLFSAEIMARFPSVEGTVIDISETSLGIVRSLLARMASDVERISFRCEDFAAAPTVGLVCDFLIMGEVLEHVDDPLTFLKKSRSVLDENGRLFLSTCVNCPAKDHVYRFHNLREIRDLLGTAGFVIENEFARPVIDRPESRWEEELVTVNYAAILSGMR